MGPFETERLILRPMQAEDVPMLQELIYSDPDVWEMYSGIGNNPEELISRFVYHCHQPTSSEFGRLVVVLKTIRQPIGQVHLDPYVNDLFQVPGDAPQPFRQLEVELAFAFGKAYWGQSFAYEACLALVDYAFQTLCLPRLVGGALLDNHRSVKLQRRLGFKVSRNAHPDHSGWWVSVLENPNLTHDESPSSQ